MDQKQIEPGAFFLLLLLRPCISIESRSFGERERAIEKSELIRFQGTLVLIYSTYIQEHYRKIYQLNLATTSSPPFFSLPMFLKGRRGGIVSASTKSFEKRRNSIFHTIRSRNRRDRAAKFSLPLVATLSNSSLSNV